MVTRKNVDFTQSIAPHPRTPREFKQRVRSISLTDALIAVEWLNAAKGSADRTRVLGIRADLEHIGKMLASLRNGGLEKAKLNELAIRQNQLNETFSHYTFCPVMAYDAKTGAWRYNAVPKKGSGLELEVTHHGMQVRINEAAVVAALARLAANGELHKVRLCEQCKENWRVSEREIDRFCSAECRQAHYEKRPEFKDRRQEIQRQYRDRQKKEDAKALALVRAQLKGRS